MLHSIPHRRAPRVWPVLGLALALSGCDMLGIETPAQTEAKRETEGRAIGGACRHAVRSIEDCYQSNPKAAKAAVFDGWREMDAYMRDNNIQGMPAGGAPSTTTAPTPPQGSAETNPAPPGTQSR